ncbi:hypothetical protein [Promicromonospora aerolata]|uniref:DDE family transposase n=1 Tax=Promicromonospora aerolata TaxID=195749 RepID=A0ABW4VF18_9MICO
MRRNDTIGELAWYRCCAPRPVAIGDLARVAGRRWTVEENFQATKSHTGLDKHQVRRWHSWHRWTTLAMLAHARRAHYQRREGSITAAHRPDLRL